MKKRVLPLLLTLVMLLGLLPAAALAADIPGQVYTASNGDGSTPFNLQWKDKKAGIISFDKPSEGQYRVEVYQDGKHIGTGGTVGNFVNTDTEEVYIGDLMLQSGTYVFTIHGCTAPNTELDRGQVAKSEPYVYTAPKAMLGAPTNLRFEVRADGVYCVWAAPANWVAGRDGFEVDLDNKSGGGTLSIGIKETQKKIDFSVFGPNQYDFSASPDGIYVFGVKAVTGDLDTVRSATEFTHGTATYSHPDGTIVNPAGTTPPPVVPPAPPVTPAATAYMREQAITVDGKQIKFQTYALKDEKGNETNYVKLRDVASALNGTSAQFNVGWNGSVNIETGKAYVPNGSEMSTPFAGDRVYTQAATPTNVNGAASGLAAIVLTDDKGAGYTYYKLRDLGDALGFKVDWTAADGITVDTGKSKPAGKIEYPAVTDPTLTAPKDLKLVIDNQTAYKSDGHPVQVPNTYPSITWTNTAGARANAWYIQLFDDKDVLLMSTYTSVGEHMSFGLTVEETATIATITVTPVDEGADGYVSSGLDSDDKMGVTAEFKCNVAVKCVDGPAVTMTTSPTEWSEEDVNLHFTLTAAPFAFVMLNSAFDEVYPDGGTARHEGGRSLGVDETGKLGCSEEIARIEERYTADNAQVWLSVFTEPVVTGGTTGSYTVTIHPVTVQK